MKKILGVLAVVVMIGSSSCSQQPVCCDGGTSALYAGQTDICYGDNLASQGKDEQDWKDWMESIGCTCN